MVSIVTGIYNSARYLTSYIRMLQQQTFADWEAILVDDGSSDDSCAIIERYAAEDQRLRLIRKEPEGLPSRARALGLNQARGPYVAFCDHDDFWAPQKLALQIYALQKFPNIAILHTDRFVWRDEQPPDHMYQYHGNTEQAPIRKQLPEEVIYRGLRIIFSSFIAPTELVKRVGFHHEMKGVDDFYLFIRLAQLGDIYCIELPLTYYYAHSGNLSHTQDIFVKGLKQVYQTLQSDDVPQHVRNSILAQAYRTEAVSLFVTDRKKALQLLIKSLRLYFIASTLNRLLFLLATFFVPTSLQRSIMRGVKILKFKLPTLKDVGRKGSNAASSRQD